MTIEDFGWSVTLQSDFVLHAAQGLIPARVTAHHRGLWRLVSADGELAGRLSGKYALEAGPGEYPAVGDWLAVSRVDASDDATIHALLPRRTTFTRRAAGDVGVQVVAANVDVAFLVAAMNGDLNARRLERYLVATRDSGAAPVIVLTKADISEDRPAALAAVSAIAGDAPIVVVSAKSGEGLAAFDAWLKPGVTAALLGSSGAGKSTLLNALAGQALMDTGAIRDSDDRGRHTTTHRELFRLPGGALLVDTPGMRELGLLEVEEALDVSFDDVTSLFDSCRFGGAGRGVADG
jgi:ribosome biogenesis GTPase